MKRPFYTIGFKFKEYSFRKLILEHLGLKECCTHKRDCCSYTYKECHDDHNCVCNNYIDYVTSNNFTNNSRALFPGLPEELNLIDDYVEKDWDFYIGVTRKENNIHLEDNEKQALEKFREQYIHLLKNSYISLFHMEEY